MFWNALAFSGIKYFLMSNLDRVYDEEQDKHIKA